MNPNQEMNGKPVFYLAWTTTPWTLPSNLALAVNKGLTYAYVDVGDAVYVACKNTLANFKKVFGEEPKIVKRVHGQRPAGPEVRAALPLLCLHAGAGRLPGGGGGLC